MRTLSKSPVRIARQALAVGRAALPAYSGPHAKHTYTQPQLFALLVLRQLLSQGMLQQQYIACKALPGERGQVIMVPFDELPDYDWS